MKKTAVVYWSGTGNTEAMAKAVAEGMESAGAQVTMLTPDQVKALVEAIAKARDVVLYQKSLNTVA